MSIEINHEHVDHLLSMYGDVKVPNPTDLEGEKYTLREAVALCPTPENGINPVRAMLSTLTIQQAEAVFGPSTIK